MWHDYILPEVAIMLRERIEILREYEVQESLDERCFANSGDRFISIYPGSTQLSNDPDESESMDHLQGFNVGITQRTGQIPEDRLFKYAYAEQKGLLVIARRVLETMRARRWELIDRINNRMNGCYKLVEPFKFAGSPVDVIFKNPSHWNADLATTDEAKHYGIFCNLEFTGGRVMKSLLVESKNDGLLA